MPADVEYSRHQHAGHYGAPGERKGHDVEVWDVTMGWTDPRPDSVPSNAERDYGYSDGGVSHVVFRRIAPLTGDCPRCSGEDSP